MPDPSHCIFCEIIAGRSPASLVYQDDQILAFMDIRPVRPGQLLIIPRTHIDHFSDLPDDLAIRLVLLGQQISRVMRRLLSPRRVGMIVHGFGVPHAHLVVLPLEQVADITSSAFAYIENGAVKFRWEQVPPADRAELDALAERLAEGMH
jgi:histidine triad (HIT) family protein